MFMPGKFISITAVLGLILCGTSRSTSRDYLAFQSPMFYESLSWRCLEASKLLILLVNLLLLSFIKACYLSLSMVLVIYEYSGLRWTCCHQREKTPCYNDPKFPIATDITSWTDFQRSKIKLCERTTVFENSLLVMDESYFLGMFADCLPENARDTSANFNL